MCSFVPWMKILFEEIQTTESMIQFIARRDFPLSQFYFLPILFFLLLFTWISSIRIPFALIALFVVYYLSNIVVQESVTAIRDFGIQLHVKYLFGAEDLTLLHRDNIGGLLIQEVLIGNEVKFFFSILRTGDHQIRIAYKGVNPGLEAIQKTYSVCSEFFETKQ